MKEIKHSLIGSTDPSCPYCGITFNKIPSRKSKCKNCNNIYFVKTRPADRKKVFLTEIQSIEIEKQWEIQHQVDHFNKEYSYVKKDFDQIKDSLTKQYGFEPRDNDVFWATYNQLSEKFAKSFDWGLYRNNRLKMSELLVREKKLRQALDFLLEISYIDANGPRNSGKIDWELFKLFPPFDLKLSMHAPGILSRIVDISKELNISQAQLRQDFIFIARRLYFNLKILIILPEDAWESINSKINWAE